MPAIRRNGESMKQEVETKIKAEMLKYESSEYDLYNAEAGWQDWMNEYTTAKDGEECSDKECNEICKVQRRLWKEAHGL